MRILLLYFSGTGNTQYIATKLKEELEKHNHLVSIKSIEHGDVEEDADLIGIGYPIYAFNAPLILEKYLKKQNIMCSKYFIFKTSGEPLRINNSSSKIIKRIMKKKKSAFQGEYHLIMPYNILFRFEDEFVQKIMYYNDLYIKYIAMNINSNKYDSIKSNVFISMFAFILRLQRLGALVNSKRYKIDEKKCINCQKCLKECPVSNITLKDNKYVFGKECQMCMRCSFNCPTNAIKIGLINKWKVNGKYDLEAKNNEYIINKKSKRFYRYFIKYYKRLDSILNNNISEE